MFGADDIVDQQLAARSPEDPRHAVDHQQYTGMPDLDGVGEEQERPRRGDAHVHDLRRLNDFPAIEAVRQRAEVDGEKQERRPVAEHGKAGEHRRVKFLIQQPVADHMLDVVRHHRQHGRDEEPAKAGVLQRRKGDFAIVLGQARGGCGGVA